MKIPVHYVDRPGFTSEYLSEKSPVVEVQIGYVSQAGPKLKTVRALIDTGADDIFVDESVLIECGCPVASDRTSVRSAHGTKDHAVYEAFINFPAAQLGLRTQVISSDYAPGERSYQAVFGTRFLELGVLVIDPNGESYFTVGPQKDKP
ncbi:aspartyl protease family protein [Bradyrhizobium sp. SZCCHNPS1003]|uniref:aspartyl protease family protein n=1 Tax=Bradyrhizobium sp. SZCCHNPS1003 TaxID=3057330 RepID=UPI0028E6D8B7|nr:aspartyl protease family protein [Bradyrhizobium sp. SZCCHNPS1003]